MAQARRYWPPSPRGPGSLPYRRRWHASPAWRGVTQPLGPRKLWASGPSPCQASRRACGSEFGRRRPGRRGVRARCPRSADCPGCSPGVGTRGRAARWHSWCVSSSTRARDRDSLVFGSRSRTSPSKFGFGAETDFRPALSEFAESPSGCQRRFGLVQPPDGRSIWPPSIGAARPASSPGAGARGRIDAPVPSEDSHRRATKIQRCQRKVETSGVMSARGEKAR